MKLHLTGVTRYTEGKDGTPLKTKDGRPYTRLVIKTDEYQAKTISGFDNEQTKNWKIGDEVEAEVEQKGEYLNFKLPNEKIKTQQTMETILKIITNVRMDLAEVLRRLPEPKRDLAKDYPQIPPEEMPTDEPPF